MLECYRAESFSCSLLVLDLETAIGELERIVGLRRYDRENLLKIVDQLRSIKAVFSLPRWADYLIERDVLEHCVLFMKVLCALLQKQWLKRRRMRKALMKVEYILNYSKNKMERHLDVLK